MLDNWQCYYLTLRKLHYDWHFFGKPYFLDSWGGCSREGFYKNNINESNWRLPRIVLLPFFHKRVSLFCESDINLRRMFFFGASWCIVCWKKKHQASSFLEWVLTGKSIYLIWMLVRSCVHILTQCPALSINNSLLVPCCQFLLSAKLQRMMKFERRELSRAGRPQNIKQMQSERGCEVEREMPQIPS